MTMRIVYTAVRQCTLCNQPAHVLQAVHAVIWDFPADATAISPSMRNHDYRIAAKRVLASHDVTLEEKAVSRHAEHVEKTGHLKPEGQRNIVGERKVFGTDYTALVDATAQLGGLALSSLAQRLEDGDVKDRELVAIAKMGVDARVDQQKLELRQQSQSAIAAALFAIAGGFIDPDELPAETGLVINVTELETGLRDELESERAGLMEAAGHQRRIPARVERDPVAVGRPDGPD